MATYIVTTSNWNSAAFWNSISESGPGHTLDFSALPSNFTIDFWPAADRINLFDGTSTFTIGDSDFGGSADATMGGTTQLEYFTTVIGSDGDDLIDGGAENDTLAGGDGNDSLTGEDGNDIITGGSGSDTLSGGDGADELFGEFGNDSILGGAGNDIIQGEEGNDTIDGGSGDDTINVSEFADVDQIDGGESAGDRDELVFVSATPVLVTFTDLEDGTYAYSGGGASGTFANIEHLEGGSGNDTLDFSGLIGAVTVTYTDDYSGTITDGADTITFSDFGSLILTEQNDSVDASASHDGEFGDAIGVNIEGRGGDDTIIGGNGGDTIDGGAGADEIDGDYGDDILSGGIGNDTILGGTGNDSILGGDGNDSIDGGIEGDTLEGGDGNDTIVGDDGNDSIEGGIGDDSIDGGDENDSIRAEAGNDTIIGGDGNDSLDGGEDGDSLEGGTGNDTLQGREGDDILLGGTGGDIIDGGDGTDTINGGDDNDTLLGQSGNDSIDGDGGDDLIFSHSGADTVVGGDGNDRIDTGTEDDVAQGGLGEDSLYGQSGNDSLLGEDGNDFVSGGDGEDTLEGGAGTDTLDGDSGNDSISGGGGNDTFIYNAGDGSDTITDFNFGNTGALGDGDNTNNDFIDLSAFYTNITELRADFADNNRFDHSNSATADYSDNTAFSGGSVDMQGASSSSEFTTDNTGVTCFTAGTAIRTPSGDILIEDLRVGDLVITADNGAQPIRWIGSRTLDRQELASHPNLRPVLIKAHVLDNERPLLVSPQHCLLLGTDKFVRAKHLAEKTAGVRIAHGKRSVCYVHLMFDAHQVIFAENAPSESFYPGPTSLRMITSAARDELFSLFPILQRNPDCRDAIASKYGTTARQIVKKRDIGGDSGYLRFAMCP